MPQRVKTITFKSLLLLSVGYSQIKMTKITDTFKCRHGKANPTDWGTKTQSFSPFVGEKFGSLYEAKQFLTKNRTSRNCGSLPLSRGKHSFHFLSPFPLLSSVSLGAGGGGGRRCGGVGCGWEPPFCPTSHPHLSPTWSWYKYCTISLKRLMEKTVTGATKQQAWSLSEFTLGTWRRAPLYQDKKSRLQRVEH